MGLHDIERGESLPADRLPGSYIVSDRVDEIVVNLRESVQPNTINYYCPEIVDLCESQANMLHALQVEGGYSAVDAMCIVLAHTRTSGKLNHLKRDPNDWRMRLEIVQPIDMIDPDTAEVTNNNVTTPIFHFEQNKDFAEFEKLEGQADKFTGLDSGAIDFGLDSIENMLIFASIADQVSMETGNRVLLRPFCRSDNETVIETSELFKLTSQFWKDMQGESKTKAMKGFDQILGHLIGSTLIARQAIQRRLTEIAGDKTINATFQFGSFDSEYMRDTLLSYEYKEAYYNTTYVGLNKIVSGIVEDLPVDALEEMSRATEGKPEVLLKLVSKHVTPARREFEAARFFVFQYIRSVGARYAPGQNTALLTMKEIETMWKEVATSFENLIGSPDFDGNNSIIQGGLIDDKDPGVSLIKRFVR